MSRTHKNNKGPGYEYWSGRAKNRFDGGSIGSWVKKMTNKWERRKKKVNIKQEKRDFDLKD